MSGTGSSGGANPLLTAGRLRTLQPEEEELKWLYMLETRLAVEHNVARLNNNSNSSNSTTTTANHAQEPSNQSSNNNNNNNDSRAAPAPGPLPMEVPFWENRSVGIDYGPVLTAASASGGGAASSNSNGGGAAAAAGQSSELSPAAATAATAAAAAGLTLPCGEAYAVALRAAWRAPNPNRAGAADNDSEALESDLDDSYILECVEGPEGSELETPVPLAYMIDLFIPMWEEEGLYEVVRRRERAAEAAGSK